MKGVANLSRHSVQINLFRKPNNHNGNNYNIFIHSLGKYMIYLEIKNCSRAINSLNKKLDVKLSNLIMREKIEIYISFHILRKLG